MPRYKFAFSATLVAASLCNIACAQTPDAPAQAAQTVQTASTDPRAGWFPFVIPALSDAQTAGSALDLSFLNPQPAGSNGFLRARGERIVDGTGREIKLFGTNITNYSVMPPKNQAIPIAARLRELGVNFVRLHSHDRMIAPDGLINADRETINLEKLDQMDWLIYQLKQHGIYVDINLHVARRYADLPDNWDWMGKGIDRVHPKLVESQKRFARALLTHVNPYTKTAYTDEPAVAGIELNNENTALSTGGLAPTNYLNFSDEFRAPVRALWNEWLRAKYKTTDRLRAAWDGEVSAPGPQLLRNADFGAGAASWDVEASGGAQASVEVVAGENGTKILLWNASKAGGAEYNLQLHQTSVPVRHDTPVRLRFRARAAKPQTLQVRLMQQQGPWSGVFPARKAQLTAQWQQFDYSDIITNAGDAPVRLSFNLLNTPGVVELADVSLREGGEKLVGPEVSLEQGNVPLLGEAANARARGDYLDFIAERERQTSSELMRLVRDELGAQSLV